MAEFLVAQSMALFSWFKIVDNTLKEPYLDEVFHVPQAQQYCHGHFDVWDPKITTPPGLYLLSYLSSPILGCNLTSLRFVGPPCMILLIGVLALTYSYRRGNQNHALSAHFHHALNMTLFPPLFCFSALYYTDVSSTLSVVAFYSYFLYSYRANVSPWLRTPVLLLLGSTSLLFRQTNIFWVAVFPMGVILVSELDRGHQVIKDSMLRRSEGFGDSIASIVRTSWKMKVLFDPSVRDAWFEDYAKTMLSIGASGLRVATQPEQLRNLMVVLAPFITLIIIFAAFVLWNGSVVLGDKSNHVATIHLPQMLYIWPYITFFSWPLLYPYFATLPIALLSKMPNIAPLESMLMFRRRHLAPRTWLLALPVGIACLVVHFNTIVHPFTLADNRHYTFYIFRLLTRPVWMRYAVTPTYVVCGWACIEALGARPLSATRPICSKGTEPTQPTQQRQRPLNLPDGTNSATTSFVLILLATTTLQLITAPLVEPRYFILPWLFWRLHLPLQVYSPAPNTTASAAANQVKVRDNRLLLETVWYLTINAVVGYIFLNWGFTWPQEPGKVQRFMW